MRASQPWCFFCVITPGLEDLALAEFREKRSLWGGDDTDPAMLPGGMEITLPWEQGIGLVHCLKIPTRVMVRLTKITARDFPKFHQKALKLPWTKWLSHPTPEWKISAHQCRLMHTGRIEETLVDALRDAGKQQPFSSRYQKENIAPETVYVRGVNDEWTFSLDITGVALYKRGTSGIKGEAPLRETLAAAILRFLFATPPQSPVHLWDPMCGSGTLLLEASSHHTPFEREFAYQKSILNLGVAPFKPKSTLPAWPVLSFVGSDINANLLSKLPKMSGITWRTGDVLTTPAPVGPFWIISNPPYGERLELSEGIEVFAKNLSKTLSTHPCDRVLLLVPKTWPTMLIRGQRPSEILGFSNGGLAVEARLWCFDGQKPPSR
jgi:putative N6-adenine-specific DNA methylase